MKIYKSLFLILGSSILLLYSCSKTPVSPKSQSLQFSDNVTTIIEGLVETDTQKIEIMETYNKLGGSKSSQERGQQACEELKQGKPIDKLIQEKLHFINWAIDTANLPAFAKSESEVEELLRTKSLYESEIRAAQNTICPETHVELKF